MAQFFQKSKIFKKFKQEVQDEAFDDEEETEVDQQLAQMKQSMQELLSKYETLQNKIVE